MIQLSRRSLIFGAPALIAYSRLMPVVSVPAAPAPEPLFQLLDGMGEVIGEAHAPQVKLPSGACVVEFKNIRPAIMSGGGYGYWGPRNTAEAVRIQVRKHPILPDGEVVHQFDAARTLCPEDTLIVNIPADISLS